MPTVAVLLATGFEEGEALTIADILRRAHIEADLVSLDGPDVVGGHDIAVLADKTWPGSLLGYDMVVLPGGLPGATNLRDDARVIEQVKAMNEAGRWVCAICAAPLVLAAAGVLDGRRFTGFPTRTFEATGTFVDEIVVRDGNIITSQGPATAYAFGYALVDALGGDSLAVKNRMAYFNAFDETGAR